MSKSAELKRKKESLAKILQDPAKRPMLAKQLAPQVGSEDKTGGLGLLKSMAKDYPDEVQHVMDLIESMPKPDPKPAKAKKTTKKKAPAKKKTTKKAPAKKTTKKKSGKKAPAKKTTKKKSGKKAPAKKKSKKKTTKKRSKKKTSRRG